mmetsp:Transcript_55121/g.87949  ORF Transcript_55121/g.87949 Transcript_55121/m.87949 type:complete len:210 (-) Transcript_55121:958-1587(-)
MISSTLRCLPTALCIFCHRSPVPPGYRPTAFTKLAISCSVHGLPAFCCFSSSSFFFLSFSALFFSFSNFLAFSNTSSNIFNCSSFVLPFKIRLISSIFAWKHTVSMCFPLICEFKKNGSLHSVLSFNGTSVNSLRFSSISRIFALSASSFCCFSLSSCSFIFLLHSSRSRCFFNRASFFCFNSLRNSSFSLFNIRVIRGSRIYAFSTRF